MTYRILLIGSALLTLAACAPAGSDRMGHGMMQGEGMMGGNQGMMQGSFLPTTAR